MKYTVNIHDRNGSTELFAEAGTNLLSFLRENSIIVNTPCNGNGTCGKCRIKVQGILEQPSPKESSLLGEKQLQNGYRLACYNNIENNLDIFMDNNKDEAKIMISGQRRKISLSPAIQKKYVELAAPSLENQVSDLDQVLGLSEKNKQMLDIEAIRELPEILRRAEYKVTLGYYEGKLAFVEPGDTTGRTCGVAVDIGTTTIAAYLLDLNTGKQLDVYSMLNPQRKFGADVLSRIDYTLSSDEALLEMHNTIIGCINEIIDALAERSGVSNTDIYTMTFAGNTTMMHFLMRINARYIASSPFIPVTTITHQLRASQLKISINPNGLAIILPSVSAYIGADTVAAVLSSGIYSTSETCLLLDIGTNGEMVLVNSKQMYACSTAAGPAFEGANIRNGVGGINGAIDKISLVPQISITTIGRIRPVGICGSGIVDAVASLLDAGVIDETGRLFSGDDEEADELPGYLKERLVKIDGMNSFLIVKAEDSATGEEIAITQKDIRELQNAKAAIAAGIKIMAKEAGVDLEKIEHVYLAGGFGSYIDIKSAIKIGLLPSELEGKVKSIGNAAGSGAVEALLSSRQLSEAEDIGEKIEYIELSAKAAFVDEYVECMLFE